MMTGEIRNKIDRFSHRMPKDRRCVGANLKTVTLVQAKLVALVNLIKENALIA